MLSKEGHGIGWKDVRFLYSFHFLWNDTGLDGRTRDWMEGRGIGWKDMRFLIIRDVSSCVIIRDVSSCVIPDLIRYPVQDDPVSRLRKRFLARGITLDSGSVPGMTLSLHAFEGRTRDWMDGRGIGWMDARFLFTLITIRDVCSCVIPGLNWNPGEYG